jgi:crossover junction endodeoxyribonuclease RusA
VSLVWSFYVPGRPVPLDRARSFWNDRARGVGVRNTPRVRAYKELVQLCCLKDKAKPPAPLQGPVKLTLRFYMKPPQADLSNLVKIVEDALNKMVYQDDRQVKKLDPELIEVRAANAEGTSVTIEEWEVQRC